MWDLLLTSLQGRVFSPLSSDFSCHFHPTIAPYYSACTLLSLARGNNGQSGHLLKRGGVAEMEMEERWIEEHFCFFILSL
jgi:hypothetical protein